MTLTEIVAQLKRCGYRCEAGPLEMNVAFQELEEMAARLPEKYKVVEDKATRLYLREVRVKPL